MPLYDYKCGTCGYTFDALGKPDEPKKCPCGSDAARQPGTPAFALRGPGWTDKGRPVSGKPGGG